jgi:type IV secretion system protein VirB10
MKSKPRKPDPELEQDDESIDIEAKSPAVASAKKSKVAIIAASSILITVVVYLMFFKGGDENQKLEEVEVPSPSGVAPSETGKSPFELEQPEKKPSTDVELLAKPAVPEVPSLPELPEGVAPQDQTAVLPTQEQQKQVLPTQPTQVLPTQVANPVQPLQPNPVEAQPQVDNQPEKKEIDPRYSPIIVFSGGDVGPGRGVGYDKNIVKLNDNGLDSLKKTEPTVIVTYISDRPHTVAQGKLITAVLETAINTEIPGSVRAIVSRDVYGEAGKEVLIPRGSRLFGSYTSKIVKGQGRVEIGWKRLIRPDGVDLTITFNASDQFGRAGIPGEIDNKYGSVIANSLLTSILTIGAVAAAQSLFSDQTQANTTIVNPAQGTTTTTASSVNQAIYDVSKTITDTVGQVVSNTLNVNPVIRVPQGTKITVIVNADIKVPYMSGKK